MNKTFSIFLLAITGATIFANPILAESVVFNGQKDTYTVNNDTYYGCLHNGGCIFIGHKYLVNNNLEREGIAWKKGEYVYNISENSINVYKNDRLIFEDSALSR